MNDQSVNTNSREKAVHRIHRLQGQLVELERAITGDRPCEHLIIQARTVEKAMVSLSLLILQEYLEDQVADSMLANPEQTLCEVKRLLELYNR